MKKFVEIQKKNLEILKQRVEKYQAESEESEDETEEIEKSRFETIFANYQGDESQTRKLYEFLENGTNTDCLICIKQVKSRDSIWSCTSCFIPYHLMCIQRWANDSVVHKKIAQENQPEFYYSFDGTLVRKKEAVITWDCPNCRNPFQTFEIPKHYECFCGREINPEFQPFIFPHSCGSVCNKQLKPNCSHKCLLLCHPLQCPPCPQIVSKKCFCQKSPLRTIRCSQINWSCGKECGKLLSCRTHLCENECHEGKCSPCKKSRLLSCKCGNSSKKIKCELDSWSCEKVCGKKLACLVHSCQQKCHEKCGVCPFKLNQTCFCGKQTKETESCTDFQQESCGLTCLKPLSCGNSEHKCLSRCHKNECSPCQEIVVKKCRCEATVKETSCSKELTCDIKCKNMKNCGKHVCNRKCCNQCSQCDKICSKTLSCGKHKCEEICHDGNCYPCVKKTISKCFCGETQISTNCGRKTRIPKCKKLCPKNTKCHHDPVKHRCHFGDCPKCTLICGEALPCKHSCLENCHDNVKKVTKDKNFVPKIPGEFVPEVIEMKKLPHPPCKTKVKVPCIGGHEEIEMECREARRISCEKRCNRNLNCSNHKCQKLCHEVTDINNPEQDENCEECTSSCTKERICSHPCSKGVCHPKDCRKCAVTVKVKCFCGLNDMYFRCSDVYKKRFSKEEMEMAKEKFMKCGGKCPKNYPCGHSCQLLCHKGSCEGADSCKKKVKLFCKCKNLKIEYSCDFIRSEKLTVLPCDEKCKSKKIREEEEKLREKQKLEEIEKEKQQKELELFEKKFGPKKFKERKLKNYDLEPKNTSKRLIVGISCIFLIAAVVIYFVFIQN